MRVRTLSGFGRTFKMWDDISSEEVRQKVELVQQLDEFPQRERPQEPHGVEDSPANVARRDAHFFGLAVKRPVRDPARHTRTVINEAIAEDAREVRFFLRDDSRVRQGEYGPQGNTEQRLMHRKSEADGADEGSDVEWIAHHGVGAAARQLAVLGARDEQLAPDAPQRSRSQHDEAEDAGKLVYPVRQPGQ